MSSVPSAPRAAAADSRAARLLLPTLCLGVMVVAGLQTLVVPILGDIADRLHSSATSVSWVVTANLLAAAVLTPLLGRLGELRGKRRVLLGILVAVVLGSLLAALTSSLPLLIVGRILQGSSYGIFPLAMGVLREELGPRQLTSAMAVVGGALGFGGGIGLVLTGVLTRDHADYHRVFWLSAAVALLALVLTAVAVPERAGRSGGRLDWAGAAVLGVALTLLLLPLSQGSRWGWGSAATLGCLLGSLAVFAGWLLLESRLDQPVVAPRLLLHRSVLVTHLAGLFIGAAMFIAFIGVSTLVETPRAIAGYGFGASVLAASSVYLLPGVLSGVFTAPLGGRLVRRYGGRATLAASGLIGVAGFTALASVHSMTWEVILGMALVTTSINFGYAAMPALLAAAVPLAETSVANSVNSIARAVGSSLASALIVTLLSSRTQANGMPSESAYVIAFGAAAIGCGLAALLVVLVLPKSSAPQLITGPGPAAVPAQAAAAVDRVDS